MTDRAGDWIQERGEDARNMGQDAANKADEMTDRAGDWIQERGEDIKDATR
jgi:hypothetical protein